MASKFALADVKPYVYCDLCKVKRWRGRHEMKMKTKTESIIQK